MERIMAARRGPSPSSRMMLSSPGIGRRMLSSPLSSPPSSHGGGGRRVLAGSPPPPPPLFSASSSDHTATSSNVSTKSGGGNGNDGLAAPGSLRSGGTGVRDGGLRRRPSRRMRDIENKALGRRARQENDAMVYLEGPGVYTCGECRTHLTSHDDIISKSFHGRHGRAYLFDQCVNITTGPAEDRVLITGLHSVSDIFCKRCDTLVGWTYARAYEPSQRYKEGKFIIEKINLHLEESEACYDGAGRPAGERGDRWRARSMSWGDEGGLGLSAGCYGRPPAGPSVPHYSRARSCSLGGASAGVMGSPGGSRYSRAKSFSGSLGMGAGESHRARARSCSLGGGSGHPSKHVGSAPQAPHTPTGRDRKGSGAMTTLPLSPRSPSDIIYEYRHDDEST